jgi:hypothetical protein
VAKVPTMYENQCPECHVPFDVERTKGDLKFLAEGACTIGVCQSCGHVIAISVSDDRQRIEASSAPYDWLHDESFSDQDRRHAREKQEEVHHAAGHWG